MAAPPVGGTATVSGSQTPTLTLRGVPDADNGSYYCAITGSASGQTINSAAATLTVQDPLTIVSPPMSLTERAGDHVAFSVVVTGGGPQFQWSSEWQPHSRRDHHRPGPDQYPNGQQRDLLGDGQQSGHRSLRHFNATLTVINGTVLPLSSTNLVVARVGDGAQTLSGATGNTLYLDQYTTSRHLRQQHPGARRRHRPSLSHRRRFQSVPAAPPCSCRAPGATRL